MRIVNTEILTAHEFLCKFLLHVQNGLKPSSCYSPTFLFGVVCFTITFFMILAFIRSVNKKIAKVIGNLHNRIKNRAYEKELVLVACTA